MYIEGLLFLIRIHSADNVWGSIDTLLSRAWQKKLLSKSQMHFCITSTCIFFWAIFSPLTPKLTRIIKTDRMYVTEIWKWSDYVDARVA